MFRLRLSSPVSALVATVLLAAGCATAPAPRCAGSTVGLRTADVLTVGVDLAYPPYAFEDPATGEPTGFEVELLSAVSDRLQLKILIVNRSSPSLIPGVLAHRHDLAASALRDADDLVDQVCTSAGYLDADLGILVPSGNPREIADAGDLRGRMVGVVRATRADGWARDRLGSTPSLVRFGAPEDLLADIAEGKLDAAVTDLAVAQHAQMADGGVEVASAIDLGSSFVFAAAPDNGPLIDLVNDALKQLQEDGTRRRLERKWFGRAP